MEEQIYHYYNYLVDTLKRLEISHQSYLQYNDHVACIKCNAQIQQVQTLIKIAKSTFHI